MSWSSVSENMMLGQSLHGGPAAGGFHGSGGCGAGGFCEGAMSGSSNNNMFHLAMDEIGQINFFYK